tara:strand:+ start:1965 stop:4514 length:2550 start_codon:yes stop_codon:yes gene_type:complete
MASISIPGIGSVEVPEFATDYTLNQILSVLSSQESERLNALSDIEGGISREAGILRASLAEQRDTSSDTGALKRAQQAANKTSLQTLQHMKKQHRDLEKGFAKSTRLLPVQTSQILRSAASMVGGKGISDVLSMMPGNWGQGIALATKVVGEFADSQRRLTDVGFGLGTSILKTTKAVAGFNVPLSEIERISGTHAVTLDYLNDATGLAIQGMENFEKDGVKQGIVAFAQLSHSVRKSMEAFGNYGFTVTEVDSYLAEYLESDRKRGINADVSVNNLTRNFESLAMEVSAYAADTGRNRKDLMKAQLENKNRTDSATYSMMLRMKGEDAAAETFEKNLELITNEMKSRYGDNADAMIDAWIQAQTQGRGLEATAEGAEFMAMLGPAGAVLDQMARSGEAIDPATFKLFDDKLKESVDAYDTQNFALLAKQKESLNIAANMIMYSRDTSKESRAQWSADIVQKVAQHKAGETILKANEAMVEITTNLQAGLVSVTDALVGNEGALSGQLQKAITSVGQFSDAVGLFAKGETLQAAQQVGQMIADNPWQFLLGTMGSSMGLLGALGVGGAKAIPGGMLSGAGQGRLATELAAQNVAGGSVQGGNWVDKAGGKTAIKDGKFNLNGVEYEMKNGKPTPTAKGIKSIRGGGKPGAGTVGGLFTLAMAAYGGYQEYSAEKEGFASRTEGMDTKSAKYKELEAKSEERIQQIVKNTLAKGGGGALGGAAMGTLMGMFTANPILMGIAGMTGAYVGWELGDEMTKVDQSQYSSYVGDMSKRTKAETSMSSEEIKTRYQRDAKMQQAQTDPTYLKLEAIRKLLEDMGGDVSVTAGATSSTAIDTKKNNQNTPSGVHPP